jgi:energy-converting hydrogenase Eha subunit C
VFLEAGRLNERRKLTILTLLGGEIVTTHAYVEALRMRNDFYNTKYHKISLRRAVLIRLMLLLMGLVATIAGMTYLDVFKPTAGSWKEAVPATVLGMLGAALSMSYTFTNRPLDEKIPDQIIGSFVVWIRLAIGGAAAFVTILIGQSGLLASVFNEALLDAPYAYMIIAFVSGFSERLFVSVIQSITKEEATVIAQNPPPAGEEEKPGASLEKKNEKKSEKNAGPAKQP